MKTLACVRLPALALGAWLATQSVSVDARTVFAPETSTLATAVERAETVIHGIVTDVAYRLSGVDGDAERVPHVFVTYAVVDCIKCGSARDSVTLRVAGGPDGRGAYLVDGSMPMFDVGNEDVLLIERNGDVACPLVGCLEGRFRILRDRVHAGNARPLVGLDAGRARYSDNAEPALLTASFPSPTFDELLRNPAAMARMRQAWPLADNPELRRLYDAERKPSHVIEYVFGADEDASTRATLVGDGLVGDGVEPARVAVERVDAAPDRPVSLAAFKAELRRFVAPAQSGTHATVPDPDPDRPFRVPLPGSDAAPPTVGG